MYTHTINWNEEQRQWLQKYTSEELGVSDCICRTCGDDVKGNVGKIGYRRRWTKSAASGRNTTIQNPSCAVSRCDNVASRNLALTTSQADILRDNNIIIRLVALTEVTVCTSHFMQVYRVLNPPIPCKACGMVPSQRKLVQRFCPNPALINAYIQQHTDFTEKLSDTDRICYTCYVFHTLIINKAQHKSDNHTLQQVMEEIYQEQCEHELDQALKEITLFVAQLLLKQRAILLPKLYHMLVQKLQGTRGESDHHLPSSRWLLAKLETRLSPHIAFCCKIKKCGTLLYRKDGDILHTLTQALAMCDPITECGDAEESRQATKWDAHEAATLQEAALIINGRLQQQAQTLIAQFSEPSDLIVKMQDVVSMFDPVLWSFITKVTSSVNECRGRLCGNTDTKTIRQAFCVCHLLYCTNPRCNAPFHVTLRQ